MTGWLLAVVLLWLSACAYAGQTQLSDYFQESWTTRDGLPHNTINSLNQSEDGYLWIGTWEGAARFNGREFAVYGRGQPTGLPDSGIRSISKDNDNNLILAGARGGISKRSASGWQSWPAFNVLINAVTEDKFGNLWLASEGQGLFWQNTKGERKQFTTAEGLTSDVVHSVLTTSDGKVWVGTGRGLQWFSSSDSSVTLTTVSGLPQVPVFALRQYGDTVLIGTERGLYRYDAGSVSVFSEDLSDLPVSALLVSGEQLWIGTTDRGLLRHSALGLEKLSMDSGLPNNRILSLFQDREQSIWAGTNGGLFRLRDAPFVTYTTEQGLAGDYIRAVLAHSDGSVWIGSSQGVSRYTEQGIRNIDLSAVSAGQSVLSLVEAPDGSVWIGTYSDGAIQWRDGHVVRQFDRRSGLLANEIRAIAIAEDGDLWFGTGQGLSHVSGQQVTNFAKEQGLPTPFVMALYLHTDGRLFIGTGGGVAIRQLDGRIEALDFTGLDDAEYAFGFTPDLAEDLLWMATDRGLVAYHLSNGKLTMLGRHAGLPFDKVFQAAIDHQQHLWLSSNRGILRFERQQLQQFLTAKRSTVDYELFGESDGMQSAQANGGSMQAAAVARDGSVWFATSKGASKVRPEELARFAANVPPVVIEGFKVNGKTLPLRGVSQLAAGASRIELQFAGLGFVMPQRIQYRTKLEGFDTDWVERGSNTSAEYTNLPPGNYRFMVSAAYPQGSWSEHNASFSFSIAPYFWQRSLFWLMLVVFSVLSAVLALRWRLGSLKRRAKQLSAQVAEKTFELQQQADHLRQVDQERSALLLQIKQQAQEFELQARLDPLTSLANRRAFDEALARECARSRRNGLPLCLVLVDIDHFKRVNDRYSHSVGDQILKLVATEVSQHCRQDDTVARWGGEEFALLLPNTVLTEAKDICERIRLAIEKIDCSAFAANLHISISMGIAQYAGEAAHDKLLVRSDNALYKAKQNGRNRIEVAA
ncbi:MAG: diguanylate cyclase [Chromatiaceae bacterium]|nr:diguanylate cyclase [Chromatiaceae bacterium]